MKTISTVLLILFAMEASAQQKRVEVRSADPQERRIIALEMELMELEQEVGSLLERQDSLEALVRKKAIFSLDLGAGLQQFKTTPSVYYLDGEGNVQYLRFRSDFQAALSVLLSYRVHERHHLIVNLPLFALSTGFNPGVGLFHEQLGVGLGYAYRWHRHKLFGSFNVQPYEQPDMQLLKERYRYQEPYTRLDISNTPSYRRYNPGFSMGYAFELWARR